MARVTIEDCLDNIDNRFALVIVATQRARQLKDGAEPLVQHPKNKEPVVSLREIAAGKVRCGTDLNELIGIPEDV
jgi:DNA-directed RNA polymerase subunit omega